MPMEVWKDIPGFEGIYQASNLGQIRSAPGKVTSNKRYSRRVWETRILKHKPKGRRRDAGVTLWKNGECKDYLVARLVAMAWVEGYAPGLTVNHIDGNPQNNNCNNLEWVTVSENIKKGFEDGLYSTQKAVELLSGGESYSFKSMSEASRFLGRNKGYVSYCLQNNSYATDTQGNKYFVRMVTYGKEKWHDAACRQDCCPA